jgi:hypothetical protein
MVNFFERMFSKGDKAKSEDYTFRDGPAWNEYEHEPSPETDKDVTFAPIEPLKDTTYQAVTRRVTKYRHPHTDIEKTPRTELVTAREIVHVLATAALENTFEDEEDIGNNASNLLFEFFEKAIDDPRVKLPNLPLAKQWLEARQELDRADINQYKRAWNPVSRPRQEIEEALSREESLLEQLAATSVPLS